MSELFINSGGGNYINGEGKAKRFREHNDGIRKPLDESADPDITETDEELNEEVDVREDRRHLNESKPGEIRLLD